MMKLPGIALLLLAAAACSERDAWCREDAHCASTRSRTPWCVNRHCVECRGPGDCPAGETCDPAFSCSNFRRQRARYEAVVRRARALATTPGRTIRFRGEGHFDPTARPGDTNVCAARAHDGRLLVRILAYDRHRLGRGGYLHVHPPIGAAAVAAALDEHGCGEWEEVRRIDAHWWAISSRLD